MLPLGRDARNGKELGRKLFCAFLNLKIEIFQELKKSDNNIINIQVYPALSNSVLFHICCRYFLNKKC